jgi:seryl-tRNA synthetase
LEDQIKALEAQMPALEGKKRSLSDSVKAVSVLQSKCSELQQESQALLDQLANAQMVLSRIRMKLDRIATSLMKCEYKKTRRGIAEQLRKVVKEVKDGEVKKHYDSSMVLGIERKLELLEARTPMVLMILD